MSKKITILILCLCLFVPSFSSVFAETKTPHTLLIYLNGSDLESEGAAGTSDLNEMLAANISSNLNVIVYTGGTNNWTFEGIDSNKNQIFEVKNNSLSLIKEMPKKNMGASETLTEFLSWANETYPSDKFSLIFWNHGAGSVWGYGADEKFENDSLTLKELSDSLTELKSSNNMFFEFIGFDACLMASLETANLLVDYAKYMVASEELEPGHGWNYTPILNYMSQNPNSSGSEIGNTILKTFESHSKDEGTSDSITLSVIDLSKVKDVVFSLSDFSSTLKNDLKKANLNQIIKARKSTESYGDMGAHGGVTDMADLGDFAKKLSSVYPTESTQLLSSINSAVLFNLTSTSKPDAKGLSIYFPMEGKSEFENNLKVYNTVPFDSNYNAFVNEFAKVVSGDTTGITVEAPVEKQISETDNQEYFELNVGKDSLKDLYSAYVLMAASVGDENNTIHYLGMDTDVQVNQETGVLSSKYKDYWFSLGNQFVSSYVLEFDGNYTQYGIPALIIKKGTDKEINVDIIVTIDSENPNGIIIGAREVSDSNIPNKNLIKIESGDKVIPLYDLEDDSEAYYQRGEAILVDANFRFDFTYLPDGVYLYAFVLEDIYSNLTYSDFIEVEYFSEDQGVEEPPSEISVVLNGNKLNFDVPPQIIDGRTMLPLRAVFETFGLEVGFDSETQMVSGTNEYYSINLFIGSTEAYVNNTLTTLDVAPQIVDSRTLVPVRFVAESLGMDVSWDGNTKTVTLSSK